MEWSEHDQRGKGNPCKDMHIKNAGNCGIIGIMKTVENKALMTIYRKDLTLSYRVAWSRLLWLTLFDLFRDLYKSFVQGDHQFHCVLEQTIFYFDLYSPTKNADCLL